MPNWVKNRITASENVISVLTNTDKGEPFIDFNKVIPTPAIIDTGSVPLHIESLAEMSLGLIKFNKLPTPFTKENGLQGLTDNLHRSSCWKQFHEGQMAKDLDDEQFELYISYMRAYRKTGCMNGLAWNREMWGCKWNASDYNRPCEGYVEFETPWSAPHKVIEKLCEITGESFKHEWADEDCGKNVGFRKYKHDGSFDEEEYSDHKIEGNNQKGYELAFKLNPDQRQYYKQVDGKYVYDEDSE